MKYNTSLIKNTNHLDITQSISKHLSSNGISKVTKIKTNNMNVNNIKYSNIPKVDYTIKYSYFINDLDEYLLQYELYSILDNGQNIHNYIVNMFPNLFTKKITIIIDKPINITIEMNIDNTSGILIYRHNKSSNIPLNDNTKYTPNIMTLIDTMENEISRITKTNKFTVKHYKIDIITCMQMIKRTLHAFNKQNIMNKTLVLKIFEFTKSLELVNYNINDMNVTLEELQILYTNIFKLLSIIPYQEQINLCMINSSRFKTL